MNTAEKNNNNMISRGRHKMKRQVAKVLTLVILVIITVFLYSIQVQYIRIINNPSTKLEKTTSNSIKLIETSEFLKASGINAGTIITGVRG